MSMRYDFGMVAVAPDPFGEIENNDDGTVAMFCDPEIVVALRRADEKVRAFFTASGFVLQVHENGAPPGRFPADEEDDRVAIIEKLSINLSTSNLENADWGGFDFSTFMDSLAKAQPIAVELLAPTEFSAQPVQAPARASAPQAQRMIALGVLAVGLLLLFYVASQLIL